MFDLLQEAYERAQAGKDSIFACISAKAGSSPRNAGSSMLVGSEGLLGGTIGGGKIEFCALQHAQTCLAQRRGDQIRYNLTDSEASNTGMACGGQNDVHFTFISAKDELIMKALKQAVLLYEETSYRYDSYLCLDLHESDRLGLSLIHNKEIVGSLERALSPQQQEKLIEYLQPHEHDELITYPLDEERSLLFLQLKQHYRLLIFGGGHVARALTKVFSQLEFEVRLYEDRPEFAQSKDFAPGTQAEVMDMNLVGTLATSSSDYICILTRGHRFDFLVAEQLLKKPHAYMGCIGSRTKAAKMRAHLAEAGFTDQEIQSIFCPIGLQLGNHTPEEIAISIAAQILQHKALGYCDAREK